VSAKTADGRIIMETFYLRLSAGGPLSTASVREVPRALHNQGSKGLQCEEGDRQVEVRYDERLVSSTCRGEEYD